MAFEREKLIRKLFVICGHLNNYGNDDDDDDDDDDDNLVRIFLNLTLQIGHLDRLGWHSKHTMWPGTTKHIICIIFVFFVY